MRRLSSYRKNACILLVLIIGIMLGSVGYISLRLFSSRPYSFGSGTLSVADIYQNGTLLMSIPLSSDTDSYTFTVTGSKGEYNEIQVTDGRIGILSASCPDRLCIQQGFQSTSLLPIVCLPNRLVIRIRQGEAQISPDAVTY